MASLLAVGKRSKRASCWADNREGSENAATRKNKTRMTFRFKSRKLRFYLNHLIDAVFNASVRIPAFKIPGEIVVHHHAKASHIAFAVCVEELIDNMLLRMGHEDQLHWPSNQ